MRTITSRRALAPALASAALILGAPAVASAHHDISPDGVAKHTAKAESAFRTAQSLVNQGRDAAAKTAVKRSRGEMGRAIFTAVQVVRRAGDAAERAEGAQALATLAEQRQRNVRRALAALEKASGPAAQSFATALLADAKGRDNAVQVIRKLIDKGVSARASAGLLASVERLTADRHVEMVGISARLAEGALAPSTRSILSRSLTVSVAGQAKIKEALAALRGSVPAAARQAIDRAQSAMDASQALTAVVLDRAAGAVPPAAQPIFEQIKNDLLANLPAPVPGATGGTAPDGTATGGSGGGNLINGLLPGLDGILPDLDGLLPGLNGLLPGLDGLLGGGSTSGGSTSGGTTSGGSTSGGGGLLGGLGGLLGGLFGR